MWFPSIAMDITKRYTLKKSCKMIFLDTGVHLLEIKTQVWTNVLVWWH